MFAARIAAMDIHRINLGRRFVVAACAAALLAQSPVLAAGAHEHGVARLDVALEGTQLQLQFHSPLDNLVGFERAPRNDRERQMLEAALTRLRDGAALWRPDADAQCKPGKTEVQPPRFDAAPQPKGGKTSGEHADVQASYSFECAKPQALRALEHGLFSALPRLSRVEVQVATARGQSKATLRKASPTLKLPQ